MQSRRQPGLCDGLWYGAAFILARLAAALLFVLSVVVVLIPLLVITPRLADQLGEPVNRAESLFRTVPEKPAWIEGLPLIGGRLAPYGIGSCRPRAICVYWSSLTWCNFEQWLILAAGALASSHMQVLLSLIAATVFWGSGDKLARILHDTLNRLGGPVAERAIEVAAGAIRGVAYGVIDTAAIQGVILGLGLAAAGVPSAGMLSSSRFYWRSPRSAHHC